MRIVLEGIRIAWGALVANKLRTFLTLLGNIVGIMSVIAVVSLLGGIDNYMRQEVASEGSNVFTVRRVNFFDAITNYDAFSDALKYNPNLTSDDADYLRNELGLADYVSARASSSAMVAAYDKSIDGIDIRGFDAYYTFVNTIPIETGRHLAALEDRENAQVAVIGWEIYTKLFEPRNPIGQLVRVGSRHFKVVGVAAERPSLLGQNQNRFVIVPLGAWRKLFGSGASVAIDVHAADIRTIDEAIEETRMQMRIQHGLRPSDKDDFFVSTSGQLIEIWKKISQGIMVALVSLVSIALVVGGIVLMNTMLVSVTERTREVGLRKALGARRIAIVWQFLVESATLSFFGGVIGVSIGFAIAAAVSMFSVLPYTINAGIVIVAFAITAVIGLAFGTYPAVKAARLDPVEALRSE